MQGQNIISLKGSCQHKNLVYSCENSTPDLKQNYPYFIGLTQHTFKDRNYKHNNSFKYESRRNSAELPNFICGKKKEKINVDFDWNILDKAKPGSKTRMFCLTEKYHIIFSTKSLFNKLNELITKCRMRINSILQITKTQLVYMIFPKTIIKYILNKQYYSF